MHHALARIRIESKWRVGTRNGSGAGILDFNQVWTKFSDSLFKPKISLNKLILVNASRRARSTETTTNTHCANFFTRWGHFRGRAGSASRAK